MIPYSVMLTHHKREISTLKLEFARLFLRSLALLHVVLDYPVTFVPVDNLKKNCVNMHMGSEF